MEREQSLTEVMDEKDSSTGGGGGLVGRLASPKVDLVSKL